LSQSPRHRSSSRRRHRIGLAWAYGPWCAAALITLLAIQLLRSRDVSLHAEGWGLLGSAAICFSIGCVCKVSWHLADRAGTITLRDNG
jgi:hypothetical protein